MLFCTEEANIVVDQNKKYNFELKNYHEAIENYNLILTNIQQDASLNQGDIYNEVTGSLNKSREGVYVVPCLFINTFNEWADRGDSPGRPEAIYASLKDQEEAVGKTSRGDDGKDRLENGHYVEDTGNHFVYILDKNFQPIESALITMKSTQKKKS